MRFGLFIIAFLLLITSCFAVITNDSIKVFAVTDDGYALSAELFLNIEPGEGNVWSKVGPLVGTTTQNTERISVKLANDYYSNVNSYDYKFDIVSNAAVVDGPSAGAAMALLTISMLQDKQIPETISITGTINPDGSIGPVGGIFDKAAKAAQDGILLFMIPKGEVVQTHRFDDGVKSINLISYAFENWGLKIVEVQEIDDVLFYAFSDVDGIDINVSVDSYVPQFIPDKLEFNEKLEIMELLTQTYVYKAENAVEDARNALAATTLEDADTISVLLAVINESEKMLEDSKLLFEQNYFYSASNFAFLAVVNATFVEDLSNSPELIDSESNLIEEKALVLNSKINALEKELSEFTSVDYLEWDYSSKQRLIWAKREINNILSTQTVTLNSSNEIEEAIAFDNLKNYEFANAWYEAALDFYQFKKKSVKKVLPDSILKEVAIDYISKANEALPLIEREDKDDLVRRIDSAKLGFDNEWYIASAVDAASAFSLINSELTVKDLTFEQLKETLELKITEIEDRMKLNNRDYVWPQLYLDHAKYFLASTEFYESNGRRQLAIDSAKSGISLAFMASEILDIVETAYVKLENIPTGNYITINTEDFEYNESVLVLLVSLGLLVFIFTYFVVTRKFGFLGKKKTVKQKIVEIHDILNMLDKAYANQKINEEKYNELMQRYNSQIDALELELEEKSSVVIEIDKLNAELAVAKRLLSEFRRQLNNGEITKKSFDKNTSIYINKIEKINNEIIKQKQLLEKEKADLINIRIKWPKLGN